MRTSRFLIDPSVAVQRFSLPPSGSHASRAVRLFPAGARKFLDFLRRDRCAYPSSPASPTDSAAAGVLSVLVQIASTRPQHEDTRITHADAQHDQEPSIPLAQILVLESESSAARARLCSTSFCLPRVPAPALRCVVHVIQRQQRPSNSDYGRNTPAKAAHSERHHDVQPGNVKSSEKLGSMIQNKSSNRMIISQTASQTRLASRRA